MRRRLRPDLRLRPGRHPRQRDGGVRARRSGRPVRCAARRSRRRQRQQTGAESHAHAGLDQPMRGKRIQEMTDCGRGDGEPGDHEHPHERGGRRAPGRSHLAGEQHQQRGPGRTRAQSHHDIAGDGQRHGKSPCRLHQRNGDRAQHPAQREGGHPAQDPRRASSSPIGAVAEPRPYHLDGVVQRDQRTRQRGRQRVFHHHDPVQGGGHHHHHRAQGCLHETQSHDAGPA